MQHATPWNHTNTRVRTRVHACTTRVPCYSYTGRQRSGGNVAMAWCWTVGLLDAVHVYAYTFSGSMLSLTGIDDESSSTCGLHVYYSILKYTCTIDNSSMLPGRYCNTCLVSGHASMDYMVPHVCVSFHRFYMASKALGIRFHVRVALGLGLGFRGDQVNAEAKTLLPVRSTFIRNVRQVMQLDLRHVS